MSGTSRGQRGADTEAACPYYKENFKELIEIYIQDCLKKGMYQKVMFDGKK